MEHKKGKEEGEGRRRKREEEGGVGRNGGEMRRVVEGKGGERSEEREREYETTCRTHVV